MAKWHTLIPALIGLTVQGDLAHWTFYTNYRGKIVFYPAAPALQPASPNQATNRNRMRGAAIAWQGLTKQQRLDWQRACKKARLLVQGYHLFTWWYFNQDRGPIDTIERQTGIPLWTPTINARQ